MDSLPEPIPVVLCGRTTQVGKPVSGFLRPEYEVIRFIQSFESAEAELPNLLAGRDPQSPDVNDVGTHDYSRPARAVIFGRGFGPEEVERLRAVCVNVAAQNGVAWVLGDPAKAPSGPPGPGYPESVGISVKEALAEWKKGGGVKEGLVWF